MALTSGDKMRNLYYYLRNIIKYGLDSEHAFIVSDGTMYILRCDHLRAKRFVDFDLSGHDSSIEISAFSESGDIFNLNMQGEIEYLGVL